ncbi:MAG TPA: class I SAM-dependent methyltransferase [Aggregatilineaceae bacterium]|nr:class I SAM-dependent methyltransferase [Aggregatilineaceae bacterium]
MPDSPLTANRFAWNAAAPKFYGRCVLPAWGVFGEGQARPDLIGEIAGKTLVEIGCGSGHSIQYLLAHGAAKVYGIDFARAQIDFARETNRDAIEAGQVELFEAPMEERLAIGPVDTVFSIFALGWTVDLDRTLANVRHYLKPGGRFVFSWEHPLFAHVGLETDANTAAVTVQSSYHDEKVSEFTAWNGEQPVYLCNRKISTWFQALRRHQFEILEFLEPEPEDVPEKYRNPARYYAIQKARQVPCLLIMVCQLSTPAPPLMMV